jgi:Na+/H+-dicarboxylate symporter
MRISLPLQLIAIIIGVITLGGLCNTYTVQVYYTFSLMFKECLALLLPFIVFSFVLGGILSFKKNAPLVLLILLSAIFCSNALVALLSYAVVRNLLPFISCTGGDIGLPVYHEIVPLFNVCLPQLIRSEHAMVAAVLLGLLFSVVRSKMVEQAVFKLKEALVVLLNYTVIPLLPLYVLGFLLKIRHEGAFMPLMQQYGSAVVLLIALQTLCLIIYYWVATGFSATRAMRAINNALPSYLTAFSTMSSTATVPVSVETAVRNSGNRPLAHMAMPIMANVHLLGDSIGVPVLALTTLFLFHGCVPTVSVFLGFLLYFCTSMFAVSGIPGGGIIVMIPVLKSMLGFTPEMISIITALYLLLDSFGTAANVMGDGALVMMVNKMLKRLKIVA